MNHYIIQKFYSLNNLQILQKKKKKKMLTNTSIIIDYSSILRITFSNMKIEYNSSWNLATCQKIQLRSYTKKKIDIKLKKTKTTRNDFISSSWTTFTPCSTNKTFLSFIWHTYICNKYICICTNVLIYKRE